MTDGPKADDDVATSSVILRWSRRELLMTAAFGAAAAGFGLGSVSGAEAATSAPPSEPTGQVVIGISQEPTIFNPLMVAIEVDQGVWWSVYSPLWAVDVDGSFLPRLAKEVPTVENGGVSADGLNWHVKLRDDVKWHDGQPFTAEDVKYTIELLNNQNFRAGSRNGHSLVRDIKVLSPTEITWRMERVFAPYVAILSWTFIAPKHILEKASDPNNSDLNTHPIGTGPFKWSERAPGDHITLAANTDYFGDGPYVEHIVFKYIADLTVLYTQFKTGAIDYIGIQGIPADRYSEAKDLPDRNVYKIPQNYIESILLNQEKPQFKDKTVAQALYLGMDKKSIVNDIYYGIPREAESVLPPESWVYNGDLPKHVFDPDKANKLLDDGGWKVGPDGVREKDGVKLEFTNSTTAGNHLREQTQQLLAQLWEVLSVKMTINDMPPAVVWGEYTTMGKFDSLMGADDYAIAGDPDLSPRLSSQSINAQGHPGQNYTQYSNPEVDKLIDKGTATFDLDKRREIYRKIQALVRQDLPMLPMFQWVTIEGTKKGLVGFKPNPNVFVNSWNTSTWYWAT